MQERTAELAFFLRPLAAAWETLESKQRSAGIAIKTQKDLEVILKM